VDVCRGQPESERDAVNGGAKAGHWGGVKVGHLRRC
jgi:hypothetical protein